MLRVSMTLVMTLIAGGVAYAQTSLDVDDIVGALQANSAPANDLSAEEVVDNLRARIAVVQRDSERAAVNLATPEIDSAAQVSLEIFFDYNSAEIKSESFVALLKLGEAISSERLHGAKILIVGHTDAAGSREYNLHLSERRANSVKAFLSASFPQTRERLFTIGFGEEKLRDVSRPESEQNRRVQIINLGG